MKHAPVKLSCSVMLAALALSLTACATKPPTPAAELPALPPAPSLSTPLPSESYSLNAAEAIKNWRAKQMDTRLMRERYKAPGL